jgi:hypothetical protein
MAIICIRLELLLSREGKNFWEAKQEFPWVKFPETKE